MNRVHNVGLWLVGPTLVFSLIVSVPTPATACNWAKSRRLVPLGTAGKRVVLLQLDRLRDKRFRQRKANSKKWYVMGTSLRFANARGVLAPKGIKLPLPSSKPQMIAAQVLVKRALKRARRIKGFKPFGKPTVTICSRIRRRCGSMLLVATRTGRLFVADRKRGIRATLWRIPQLSLYLKTLHKNDTDPVEGQVRRTELAGSLAVYFVLAHRLGNRMFYVVNVSNGYSYGHSKAWLKRCRSVATCVPPEADGGHHIAWDLLAVGPLLKKAPSPNGRGRRP